MPLLESGYRMVEVMPSVLDVSINNLLISVGATFNNPTAQDQLRVATVILDCCKMDPYTPAVAYAFGLGNKGPDDVDKIHPPKSQVVGA